MTHATQSTGEAETTQKRAALSTVSTTGDFAA